MEWSLVEAGRGDRTAREELMVATSKRKGAFSLSLSFSLSLCSLIIHGCNEDAEETHLCALERKASE
jgi:hypothetical protein